VDLTGKRVAVVGTGCSAIQVVPAIQPRVARLEVYQRSPGWTIPRMDFAYRERTKRLFARVPAVQRLDRMAILAFYELGAAAQTSQRWMRRPFRAIGRYQINRAIEDPELRRKVTPRDEIGCKRVMVTDDWYPALTKPNVDLVTERIAEVRPDGIVTADSAPASGGRAGAGHRLQVARLRAPMEVVGAGGRALAEEWAEVPRAYLGLTVPGFPNMFLLYGPNTNGGTGSVIFTIEAGMRHVLAAIEQLRRSGMSRIEVDRDAADSFDRELRAALGRTVWHTGCTSWYLDENGNDPSQWPWLWSSYRRRTARLAPGAYRFSAPVAA
jgi:cation diffusion facilitator CzcD-associated flavoprotein CzcO